MVDGGRRMVVAEVREWMENGGGWKVESGG
jgi:hypothetical protein